MEREGEKRDTKTRGIVLKNGGGENRIKTGNGLRETHMTKETHMDTPVCTEELQYKIRVTEIV